MSSLKKEDVFDIEIQEEIPKVSVIMPVYNTSEEYLLKAVECILEQSFKNFEFIICDDGSSVNLYEYLKSNFADRRMVLIRNDVNRGITFSLNRMIDIAKGEYIARMDADDMCRRDRIEKQVEVLDLHKEIDLVCSNAELFNSDGIWGETVRDEKIIANEDFLFNSPIIHPSICVRKQALLDIGKYLDIDRTKRCEDYDLFMRMQASGKKLYRMKEKLYLFREDEDAIGRRRYKYRINEFRTRCIGFKKLGLMPKGFFYCIKPLILGLLPRCLYKKLHYFGGIK